MNKSIGLGLYFFYKQAPHLFLNNTGVVMIRTVFTVCIMYIRDKCKQQHVLNVDTIRYFFHPMQPHSDILISLHDKNFR